MPPKIAPIPPAPGRLPRVTAPGRTPGSVPVLTALPPTIQAAVAKVAHAESALFFKEAKKAETEVALAMMERLEQVVASLDRLSDDAYNAAIIQNPVAFAAMRQKETLNLTEAEAGAGKRLYKNDGGDTVIVYARADNSPNDDVTGVLLSYTQQPTAQAQIEGSYVNMKASAVVLRPQQEVFVNVKATTYPVIVHFTVIPLRGRAAVFGG